MADGGQDNSVFELIGNSLRTKTAIDYESNKSFSILIGRTDARGIRTVTPFTIAVENVIERPVARDDSFTVNIAEKQVLDVAANDDDFDQTGVLNNLEIISQPNLGIAQVKQGKIEYSPNRTSIGSDSFSYRIRSLNGDISTVAQVIVHVDEWPIANTDVGHTRRNASLVIDVLANDTFVFSPLVANTLRIEDQLRADMLPSRMARYAFHPRRN